MSSTLDTPTTPETEPEAEETELSPAEQIARIDVALGDLEARRLALTKRSASIPGVIQDELAAIAAEEFQARQPLGALEAALADYPARIGSARAGVTVAQGSASRFTAEEALEHLLQAQHQAEEQLAQARIRCDATLAACSQKRGALEKERQELEASLAELGASRTALEQQKRELHRAAGLEVAARIADEVELLRGAVAEKQTALEAAETALRVRQELIPTELGAWRSVPQVVAATASLLTDDAQKSSPQIFIAGVAGLLDTLDRLRGTDIASISVTWEINNVLTQLANPVTVQHILSSSEGGQALIRIRAMLLAAAEHEARRLVGLA